MSYNRPHTALHSPKAPENKPAIRAGWPPPAWRALVWIACSWGCVHAAAHVQAQAAAPHIAPSQLVMPSPSVQDPDSTAAALTPAQVRAMQRLRAQAEGVAPIPRKASPSSIDNRRKTAPAVPTLAEQREANWVLGLLALHGIGMPWDAAQAERWFEKAQTLGHPLAAAGVAWCLIDGCARPPDPASALSWIQQLQAVEPAQAQYLQWLALERLAPLHAKSPLLQEEEPTATPPSNWALLESAARAGSAAAKTELGLREVTQGHLSKALQHFQSAAARSPAAAANARELTARMREDATPAGSTNPGASTAEKWYLQARKYHRGDGIPANYTEALRLYQLAANQGSQAAKRMLEWIYAHPLADGSLNIFWMRQIAAMNMAPNGSPLTINPLGTPAGYVRDPTPLWDLIPAPWKTFSSTPSQR